MHKYDPKHIERLLREERAKELNPPGLLKDAGLKEGDIFADIGSGPGFFSVPASEVVGPSGRVYAIDTQEEMLSSLKKRNPPPNVIPLKSEENAIPLKDSGADFALVAFVLHETEDKLKFLKEARRVIKDGGVLLILDWKKKKEEKGPPVEERLTQAFVKGLLKEAGFVKLSASSLNESQYKILAVKPRMG